MMKIILLIIVSITLISCELDDNNNDIKKFKKNLVGKITDNNLNGIENTTVYLQRADYKKGYLIIDSTRTNNLGNYHFNFDYTDFAVFKLTLFDNYYYTDNKQLVIDDNTDSINIKLFPSAYMNFHIRNIEPSYLSDEISFSLVSNIYEFWRLNGKNVDTTLKIRVPSLNPLKFTFVVKRNGIDSIYSLEYNELQPMEVFQEEINY